MSGASIPSRVIIEADGGARGNPGPAGYGALLRDADTGEVIADAAEYIGVASNNVAEYSGLIAGLELYREHTPDADLEVRMDSKLVVEQMSGRWKIKHANMRPLALRAKQLAPPMTAWTWVPREQNKSADALANLAMDAAAGRQADDPTPDALEAAEEVEVAEQRPVTPLIGWATEHGEPTVIVFVRHGVTVHTVDRRFSGPGGDDPGLTDEGWEQARRAGRAIAADGDFTTVIASPLRRTRETASAVGDALGLPVEIDDGFREASFGEWDGYTVDEVRDRWPTEFRDWTEAFFDVAPPGGESLSAVRLRVEKALLAVVAAHPGEKIVVVSHVNPIKFAVRYCLDVPAEAVNRMLLAPASITTLAFYETGATAMRQFSAVP
ncbi:MAG TPA: bifunctional RNase H/acid phosphatase [Nocardioidaceae bacterium]|nr:bifunctional RNase H/acid phosphatase [Nocardioidaceae bacterium]